MKNNAKLVNGLVGLTIQGKDAYKAMVDGKRLFADQNKTMTIPNSMNLQIADDEGILGYDSILKDVVDSETGETINKEILNTKDIVNVKWDYETKDFEEELKKKVNKLYKETKKGTISGELVKANKKVEKFTKVVDENKKNLKEIETRIDTLQTKIRRLVKQNKVADNKTYKELYSLQDKKKDLKVKLQAMESNLAKATKDVEVKQNKYNYYSDKLTELKSLKKNLNEATTKEEKELAQKSIDEFIGQHTEADRDTIRKYLNENGFDMKETIRDEELEKKITKATKGMNTKSKEYKETVEKLEKENPTLLHEVIYHYERGDSSSSKMRGNTTEFKKDYIIIDGERLAEDKSIVINGRNLNGGSLVRNKRLSDPYGIAEEGKKRTNDFLNKLNEYNEKNDEKLTRYDVDKMYETTLRTGKVTNEYLENEYKKALFPLTEWEANTSLSSSAIVDNKFTKEIDMDRAFVIRDVEIKVNCGAKVQELRDEKELLEIAKKCDAINTLKADKELLDRINNNKLSQEEINKLLKVKEKVKEAKELTYENAMSYKSIRSAVEAVKPTKKGGTPKDLFVEKRNNGTLTLEDLQSNKTIARKINERFSEKKETKQSKTIEDVKNNKQLMDKLNNSANNYNKIMNNELSLNEVKELSKEFRQEIADNMIKITTDLNANTVNSIFDGAGIISDKLVENGEKFVFTRGAGSMFKAGLKVANVQTYLKELCEEHEKDFEGTITDMLGRKIKRSEIDLIIPESCLKMFKFANYLYPELDEQQAKLKMWNKFVEQHKENGSKLPIVGEEHVNKLDGMAKNNYQVMASIDWYNKVDGINYDGCKTLEDVAKTNMKEVIKDQLDMIERWKKDNGEFIKYLVKTEPENETAKMWYNLYTKDEELINVKEFHDYKKGIINKCKESMKASRVLTKGANKVILPDIEALMNTAVVGVDEVERSLQAGERKYSMFKGDIKGRIEVYCNNDVKHFAGARNPHIGNFSLPSFENTYDETSRAMRLAPLPSDGLCVDCCKYAFQDITSGSDLDYDHLLTMEDETLDKIINVTFNNKNVYVPVDKTGNDKARYLFTQEDFAVKNTKVGINLVGDSSNVAQLCQAQKQHIQYTNNVESNEQIEELDNLLHRANTLQNHEIDNPKRPSKVNSAEQLGSIKRNENILKYTEEDVMQLSELNYTVVEGSNMQPKTFRITKKNKDLKVSPMKCNLDMFSDMVEELIPNSTRGENLDKLSNRLKQFDKNNIDNRRINKVIETIDILNKKTNAIHSMYDGASEEELKEAYDLIDKHNKWANNRIAKIKLNQDEYIMLINKATTVNSNMKSQLLNTLFTRDKELYLNSFAEVKIDNKVDKELLKDATNIKNKANKKVIDLVNDMEITTEKIGNTIKNTITSPLEKEMKEKGLIVYDKGMLTKVENELIKVDGKSIKRIDYMNEEVDKILNELSVRQTNDIKFFMGEIIDDGVISAKKELKGAYNLDKLIGTKYDNLLEEPFYFINMEGEEVKNVSLIKSIKDTFKVFIDDIKKQIKEAFKNKEGIFSILNRLKKSLHHLHMSVKRLINYHTTRLFNNARIKVSKVVGAKEYRYISICSSTTCDKCRNLHNKIFNFDNAVVGKNMPPMHYFCYCSFKTVKK